LSKIACALSIAPPRSLGADALRPRTDGGPLSRSALAGIEGLRLPCPDREESIRGWLAFVVQLPAGTNRDRLSGRPPPKGIQSKPYLPAIHLMSFYRRHFGHRDGEFPMCEEAAARSLALPFFPQMSERQLAR